MLCYSLFLHTGPDVGQLRGGGTQQTRARSASGEGVSGSGNRRRGGKETNFSDKGNEFFWQVSEELGQEINLAPFFVGSGSLRSPRPLLRGVR